MNVNHLAFRKNTAKNITAGLVDVVQILQPLLGTLIFLLKELNCAAVA